MHDLLIFSLFQGCLLTHLIVSFDAQMFLILKLPVFLFLFLLPVLLVLYPSNHCESQCPEAFLAVFF